jgi:hypothetical protein
VWVKDLDHEATKLAKNTKHEGRRGRFLTTQERFVYLPVVLRQ